MISVEIGEANLNHSDDQIGYSLENEISDIEEYPNKKDSECACSDEGQSKEIHGNYTKTMFINVKSKTIGKRRNCSKVDGDKCIIGQNNQIHMENTIDGNRLCQASTIKNNSISNNNTKDIENVDNSRPINGASDNNRNNNLHCSRNSSTRGTRREMTRTGSICFNCQTDNTPLWRHDDNGNILCNACGLFLKLHGRPRPIYLKTSIVKSRNRKNTNFPYGFTCGNINAHFQTSSFNKNGGLSIRKNRQCTTDSDSVLRFRKVNPMNSKKNLEEKEQLKGSSLLDNPNFFKHTLRPKINKGFMDKNRNAAGSALLPLDEEVGDPNFQHKQLRRIFLEIPLKSNLHANQINNDCLLGQLGAKEGRATLRNTNNNSNTSIDEERRHLTSFELDDENDMTDSTIACSKYLTKEEEVTKLKTRIKELELVADLCKDYIFRMNEKYEHLRDILQDTSK